MTDPDPFQRDDAFAPATTDPEINEAAIGQPFTLDPVLHPCLCVTDHNPNPRLNHRHHIIPLAWGGPDTDDNTVSLCPTTHANLHAELQEWVRVGRPTYTSLHPYVRTLLRRAWEGRRVMLNREARDRGERGSQL